MKIEMTPEYAQNPSYTVNRYQGLYPQKKGVVSKRKGLCPKESGCVPKERGCVPQKKGVMSTLIAYD